MKQSGVSVTNLDRTFSATEKWHLDKVFVTTNGQHYYLGRAVDGEGMVIDILMQTRRNAKAAKRFFEGVLGKISPPQRVVTDGLRSYNIILREVVPHVEHLRSKYLNNRVENSHQPIER
jgi:putative transposase